MKLKLIATLTMMLSLWLVITGPLPAVADTRVEQLSLQREGVFTSLRIEVPGRLLCNHLAVESKAGKPFRVVLDLCGATHHLAQKEFAELPPGVVSRIRTSQYATSPQNVVRVVLDLRREVTYKVGTDETSITLSLVTPDQPDFDVWSSGPAKVEPVRAVVTPTPKTKSVLAVVDPAPKTKPVKIAPVSKTKPVKIAPVSKTKPVTVVSVPKTTVNKPSLLTSVNKSKQRPKKNKTSIVSLAAKPTAAKPPAETKLAVATKKPTSPKRKAPVSVSPVVEVRPDHRQHQPAPAETRPAPPVEQPTALWVHQYDQPIGPVRAPQQPVAAPAVVQAESKRQSELVAGREGPTSVVAVKTDDPKTVAEELTSKSDPQEETPPPPVVVINEAEDMPLLERLRRKFLGSADEEKVALDQKSDSVASARLRALAKVVGETDLEDSGTIPGARVDNHQTRQVDPLDLESIIASVDPTVGLSSEALAAADGSSGSSGFSGSSPAVPGMGRTVRLEPARRAVVYEQAGRRDLFEPLIEGQRSGLWTTALPRVDALRLVGILQDYDGAIALFEDMEGYGYILREGDPVKDGFLKAVSDNRALFQVDEYGWVHTVVFELRKDSTPVGADYANDSDEE